MSLPRAGPREWVAPRTVSCYLCGYDDPRGGWVLLGAQPVLLQPPRVLSVHAAERGIPGDGSVVFARPRADPLGLRRVCAADFDYIDYIDDIDYVDNSDIKENAVVALSPAPASDRERQEALRDEGDACLPPLPPATAAVPAALEMPAAANHHQRPPAPALLRNTARVAAALAASAAALARFSLSPAACSAAAALRPRLRRSGHRHVTQAAACAALAAAAPAIAAAGSTEHIAVAASERAPRRAMRPPWAVLCVCPGVPGG